MAPSAPKNLQVTIPTQTSSPLITITQPTPNSSTTFIPDEEIPDEENQIEPNPLSESEWASFHPLPDSPHLQKCFQCHLAGVSCSNTLRDYIKPLTYRFSKQYTISCSQCLQNGEEFCITLESPSRWMDESDQPVPWQILDFGAERLREVELKVGKYTGRKLEVEKVGEEEVESRIWNIRREKWEREHEVRKWMLPQPEDFGKHVSELRTLSTRFEMEREKEKESAQK